MTVASVDGVQILEIFFRQGKFADFAVSISELLQPVLRVQKD